MSRIVMISLVTVGLCLVGSAAKAGTVCKSSGWVGQASHSLKGKAQKRARKDWRKKVIAHHGVAWASWSLASHKFISCFEEKRKWRCIASGVPCKTEFGLSD